MVCVKYKGKLILPKSTHNLLLNAKKIFSSDIVA